MNTDLPGAAEDEEFIELWHPSGHRTSLNGIWVLLINGNDGKIYREIELDGYYTDNQGYFLVSCLNCHASHLLFAQFLRFSSFFLTYVDRQREAQTAHRPASKHDPKRPGRHSHLPLDVAALHRGSPCSQEWASGWHGVSRP